MTAGIIALHPPAWVSSACPDDEIGEARWQVAQLRSVAASAIPGSRQQAVAAIKLEWWEGHLAQVASSAEVIELCGATRSAELLREGRR